jgi:predicted dehydrogenase
LPNLLAILPRFPVAQDLFDRASSGANLLTDCGVHTLDLVEAIPGEIIEVDARIEIQ